MTYNQISTMYLINAVDDKKVKDIANSMKENGYIGCPILICNDQLLTGSHRLAALQILADEDDSVYDWEVADDVTDIVNEAFERFEENNGYQPDMDLSNIGWMLKGSWVEEFKNDIVEW